MPPLLYFVCSCLQCKSSKIQKNEPSVVDPWSPSTRNTLLEKINGGLRKFSVSSLVACMFPDVLLRDSSWLHKFLTGLL
jgi:hypothetical protein